MDPKLCLLDCLTAIQDGDPATARSCLREYKAWRQRGGFEPTILGAPGDETARRITRRLLPKSNHRMESKR